MLVAIKYLHLHYNENINLEAIAEILGVSTTHAGRLFKKETGMSFRAYLTDIRIRKAEQLLKSGKYRVYEVSYMVVYQTIQYFSESFKNITGKKPSDYTNGSD